MKRVTMRASLKSAFYRIDYGNATSAMLQAGVLRVDERLHKESARARP